VRRAKLYYLRDRVGKRARVRERGYVGPEDIVEPGLVDRVGTSADDAAVTDTGATEPADVAAPDADVQATAPERSGDEGSHGADADESSVAAPAGDSA